jgi:hypothetical protein
MMQQIELEGFEGQQIEIKPAGSFSAAKVLVNGKPAGKGPKRGQMLLRKNDGTEVIANWQPAMMGFDVPKLVVGGKVIEIVKPLKWYEMVWSALPILLVFAGGLLGGITGFIGFSANTKVFRSKMNPVVKFMLTAGISVAAVIAYLILGILLYAITGS